MIENIIFDFGGVLINLDKAAVPRTLEQWGSSETDPALLDLSYRYEKGFLASEAFVSEVVTHLGCVTPLQVETAWNKTILDLPEDRIVFLERLRDRGSHRTFLLSNTNDLHMACVRDRLGLDTYNRFQRCFERFYLSYEMGMRKPDPEIFLHVLKENGLAPEKTLFIDDTEEHVLGAASVGLQTWLFQPGHEEISELLERL